MKLDKLEHVNDFEVVHEVRLGITMLTMKHLEIEKRKTTLPGGWRIHSQLTGFRAVCPQ